MITTTPVFETAMFLINMHDIHRDLVETTKRMRDVVDKNPILSRFKVKVSEIETDTSMLIFEIKRAMKGNDPLEMAKSISPEDKEAFKSRYSELSERAISLKSEIEDYVRKVIEVVDLIYKTAIVRNKHLASVSMSQLRGMQDKLWVLPPERLTVLIGAVLEEISDGKEVDEETLEEIRTRKSVEAGILLFLAMNYPIGKYVRAVLKGLPG